MADGGDEVFALGVNEYLSCKLNGCPFPTSSEPIQWEIESNSERINCFVHESIAYFPRLPRDVVSQRQIYIVVRGLRTIYLVGLASFKASIAPVDDPATAREAKPGDRLGLVVVRTFFGPSWCGRRIEYAGCHLGRS
jgi:hypothetical protein